MPDPIYVDREMWEKIVLNLLSNAFKFTFEGEIAVRIHDAGGAVELTVSDTGTGIPAEELPRMFERFHRVENARGRSHEGSGIGLALVSELVKLHGGSIAVESSLGVGTTFLVRIPKGAAHLPADRVRVSTSSQSSAGAGAGAYVAEALEWLPAAAGGSGPAAAPAQSAARGRQRGSARVRATLSFRALRRAGRRRTGRQRSRPRASCARS